MPVLENIEAMTVNTTPAPPTETHEPQPVRELTQTDHLNKRLLKSLLDSMMKSSADAQEKPTATESNNDSDFDD
ncbi:hypothetical protein KR093_010358 [Drosophila rubida]|uniref:Uncharacterized protein n=1 Tax=Drosophila rubida TaxID=30044 RepID=A0AAD4PQC1_9MUSC|nr:hypothetical protein KR093_010358 [Drosophila rubida]